jgi:hypothetical protein
MGTIRCPRPSVALKTAASPWTGAKLSATGDNSMLRSSPSAGPARRRGGWFAAVTIRVAAKFRAFDPGSMPVSFRSQCSKKNFTQTTLRGDAGRAYSPRRSHPPMRFLNDETA